MDTTRRGFFSLTAALGLLGVNKLLCTKFGHKWNTPTTWPAFWGVAKCERCDVYFCDTKEADPYWERMRVISGAYSESITTLLASVQPMPDIRIPFPSKRITSEEQS